jgi:CheY-like chemotaxis protein
VVDDDERVIELLRIALEAHGYRMIEAHDGEQALQVARRERPDLVVLDVRLPKRSGFDVCERLRNDPDDPGLPILLVSAAAEVETRVQGLARGADDYLIKPFSPKELVARVQRLLARTLQARESRRAGLAAERELERARADMRRSQQALEHERWLAEHCRALRSALTACTDPDGIGEELLTAVIHATGVESAALLAPAGEPGLLVRVATRGLVPARAAGLDLRRDGTFARLLAGLDRVVMCDELVRFPELGDQLGGLFTSGFVAMAPLAGDRLEGLLLLGERSDGAALDADARDLVPALCRTAAHALATVQQHTGPIDLTVDLLATLVGSEAAIGPARAAEVWEVLNPVLRAHDIPAHDRRVIAWAIRLGPWAGGVEAGRWLATAIRHDASGLCASLRTVVARVAHSSGGPANDPARIVALGWRITRQLASGVPAARAWRIALADAAGLDPAIVRELDERVRAGRRPAA